MNETQWAPKVHPLTRGVEPEDPLELMAEPAPGDPDVMLECLTQEYGGLGWDADQLLALFHDPGYPVLNQLLELFGETEIRGRVESSLGRFGVFRVREIFEEPEPDEPELIQLGVRTFDD